jgi:hypothetical protein
MEMSHLELTWSNLKGFFFSPIEFLFLLEVCLLMVHSLSSTIIIWCIFSTIILVLMAIANSYPDRFYHGGYCAQVHSLCFE